MNSYGRDYWDYSKERNGAAEIPSSTPEFYAAVQALDRLIEKARRFYQSRDYEEVVLNAHQIKELYHLCLLDEYKRQGRYSFRPTLRAKIDNNLDSLDYWWEEGIVAFQKIKIGPEIAKTALALAEEMRDYLKSYIDYRSGASFHASQASNRSFIRAQLNKNQVGAVGHAYPVKKGGLKIADEKLLYLGRPSIVGCLLEFKSIVLLVAALLFGSFFVSGFNEEVAMILRGAAVVFSLYVIGRTGISLYSERYAITEQDIHKEEGLFFKSTATIPLNIVAKYKKQQSLLGRLFRTGDLVIKTRNGYTVTFKGIYDPEEAVELVAELCNSDTFRQD